MRQGIVIFLGVFSLFSTYAQEWGISASYQYINAPQWNKAVHTYNFSRPFLSEEQPLLGHGFNLTISHLSERVESHSSGIIAGFSFYTSAADNTNLNVRLNAVLIDLGFRLRLYGKDYAESGPAFNTTGPKFYIDFTPSVILNFLSRRENGEIDLIGTEEDFVPARSYGVGLGLNLQIGKRFNLSEKIGLNPFLGFSYDPLIWNYRPWRILSESQTNNLKSITGLFRMQGGVCLSF